MEFKLKNLAAMILVVFAMSFAIVGCQSAAPEEAQEEATETPAEETAPAEEAAPAEETEGGEHPEGSEHPEGE